MSAVTREGISRATSKRALCPSPFRARLRPRRFPQEFSFKGVSVAAAKLAKETCGQLEVYPRRNRAHGMLSSAPPRVIPLLPHG